MEARDIDRGASWVFRFAGRTWGIGKCFTAGAPNGYRCVKGPWLTLRMVAVGQWGVCVLRMSPVPEVGQ